MLKLWKLLERKVFFNAEIFFEICLTVHEMPFYAVAKGRTTGIFMTWPDCENQVKSFPGARYKKFNTVVEAQEFITKNGDTTIVKQAKDNNKSISNSSRNLKRPLLKPIQRKSLLAPLEQTSVSSEGEKTLQNNIEDSRFSDDSEDLDTVLSKQMDDFEQRLKTFEKGVDKILKKGSKKTILIDPPSNKRQKTNSSGEFNIDHDGFVQVYTDGACSANGRSGARAGLGVYWGDGHPLNTSEPVSGRATNNCGEIQAATKAINQALQNGIKKLSINTDSKFLINSVTKWMPAWKKKGWKLQSGEPVKNEVDFKELDSVQHKLQIKWNYVEAHKGIHGNEMADQLAKEGAAGYNR